jgi:hypothetical protein
MLLFKFDNHSLVDAASDCRLSINDGMLPEKNTLARSACFHHGWSSCFTIIRIGVDSIVGLKD